MKQPLFDVGPIGGQKSDLAILAEAIEFAKGAVTAFMKGTES